MVDLKKLYRFIYHTYTTILTGKIRLLIVGGSIARGNYREGWSDIDLLLVLDSINSQCLRRVKKAEEKVAHKFQVDVDTMITLASTIQQTTITQLHGKVKNFIFFLSKEKILVKRNFRIPRITHQEMVDGFWATRAEQEKNFLRRNADMIIKDRSSLEKLFKKNIKIIFLILKQYLAMNELRFVPSTYKDVILLSKTRLPFDIQKKLEQYNEIRAMSTIPTMPLATLRREIDVSIKIFYSIGKIINQV